MDGKVRTGSLEGIVLAAIVVVVALDVAVHVIEAAWPYVVVVAVCAIAVRLVFTWTSRW